MSASSKAYLGLAALTFLLATLMFFLAGLFVFNGSSIDPHRTVGFILHGTTLLMLIVAAAGKLGRQALIFGGGLFVLVIIQGGLANADNVIGAFHPLVAVIFWMGSYQAFTWARTGSTATPTPSRPDREAAR
jgi:hypothetical protein